MMDDNILSAINVLVNKANELNDITENKECAPLVSGRAAWERKGILFSIKTIAEYSGFCQFEDLFESKPIK